MTLLNKTLLAVILLPLISTSVSAEVFNTDWETEGDNLAVRIISI